MEDLYRRKFLDGHNALILQEYFLTYGILCVCLYLFSDLNILFFPPCTAVYIIFASKLTSNKRKQKKKEKEKEMKERGITFWYDDSYLGNQYTFLNIDFNSECICHNLLSAFFFFFHFK